MSSSLDFFGALGRGERLILHSFLCLPSKPGFLVQGNKYRMIKIVINCWPNFEYLETFISRIYLLEHRSAHMLSINTIEHFPTKLILGLWSRPTEPSQATLTAPLGAACMDTTQKAEKTRGPKCTCDTIPGNTSPVRDSCIDNETNCCEKKGIKRIGGRQTQRMLFELQPYANNKFLIVPYLTFVISNNHTAIPSQWWWQRLGAFILYIRTHGNIHQHLSQNL